MFFTPRPGHRLEIHALKSYAAERLNCDDAGRPKVMTLGGRQRLRLSSQSLKRALRASDTLDQFRVHAAREYGAAPMIHTRRAAEWLRRRVLDRLRAVGIDPAPLERPLDKALKRFAASFRSARRDDGEDRGPETQLIAFSEAELQALSEALVRIQAGTAAVRDEYPKAMAQYRRARAEFLGRGDLSPEIALFGRMVTATELFHNVECPFQVAHAYTTHAAEPERDWWTALDDLALAAGEAAVGGADVRRFGAGVFYHYSCIDLRLLAANLAGAFVTLPAERLRDLTVDLLRAVLFASLAQDPTGGQSGFAGHALAHAAVLCLSSAFPYDASSAFETPVAEAPGGGWLEPSRQALRTWLEGRDTLLGRLKGTVLTLGLMPGDAAGLEGLVEQATEALLPLIEQLLAAVASERSTR